MALGKNVKTLREKRGWTLKDLSKASGVPVGTIGALEVRDSVRSEYANNLANGLGVPVAELMSVTTQSGGIAPLYTGGANQALAQVGSAQAATNVVATGKDLFIALGALLEGTDPVTAAQIVPLIEQLSKTPALAAELGERLDATLAMGSSQAEPFKPINPFPKK